MSTVWCQWEQRKKPRDSTTSQQQQKFQANLLTWQALCVVNINSVWPFSTTAAVASSPLSTFDAKGHKDCKENEWRWEKAVVKVKRAETGKVVLACLLSDRGLLLKLLKLLFRSKLAVNGSKIATKGKVGAELRWLKKCIQKRCWRWRPVNRTARLWLWRCWLKLRSCKSAHKLAYDALEHFQEAFCLILLLRLKWVIV